MLSVIDFPFKHFIFHPQNVKVLLAKSISFSLLRFFICINI